MGGLASGLNIALQSLLAQQTAIETTSNNIANVNTPGYARQRAELTETDPVTIGSLTLGTGVQVSQISSLRDSILDSRVNQETQQQGQLGSYLSNAQQVQTLFNETNGNGLQAPLTAFFNSLSQLASSPSDLNVRGTVVTAAQNLASAFNQTSRSLTATQNGIDRSVVQTVSQINTLTAQIATVNAQVSGAIGSGQSAGTYIDQRNQLINQLSTLVDVSTIDAGNGSLTLTTSSGAPLVVGGQNFQLTTQVGTNGLQNIFSQGTDVTSKITSGQLAGELQVRDGVIPATLSSIDSLAASLATAVNTQNQAGYDLNGAPGGNIFVPVTSTTGAAAALTVATTDGSKIAASSDGTPGDNGNANRLLDIQNQAIVNGQSPLSAYSSLVFQIGSDVSTAQSKNDAGSAVLQQLTNLQGGVSGVDVNEEAANLVRFQNAYQAAAQVTSIINSLLQTTINMAAGS